jgi:hypothetical protein
MKITALIRAIQTDQSLGPFFLVENRHGRAASFASRPAIEEKGTRVYRKLRLPLRSGAARLRVMRRTLVSVVALLVVLSLAFPALACLLPGRVMTPAERTCCQQMRKMCGSSQMSSSHTCCQQDVRPGNTSVLIAHQLCAPALQVIATRWSSPSASPESTPCGASPDRPPSHSPPDSSILRI